MKVIVGTAVVHAAFARVRQIVRWFARADVLLRGLLMLQAFERGVLRAFMRMAGDGRCCAVAAGRRRRCQRPTTVGIVVETDDGFEGTRRRGIERARGLGCVLRFGGGGTQGLLLRRELLSQCVLQIDEV